MARRNYIREAAAGGSEKRRAIRARGLPGKKRDDRARGGAGPDTFVNTAGGGDGGRCYKDHSCHFAMTKLCSEFAFAPAAGALRPPGRSSVLSLFPRDFRSLLYSFSSSASFFLHSAGSGTAFVSSLYFFFVPPFRVLIFILALFFLTLKICYSEELLD